MTYVRLQGFLPPKLWLLNQKVGLPETGAHRAVSTGPHCSSPVPGLL